MKPKPIPADFADALKAARLADFFAECTAAHQNEYLQWIAEAKRSETRKNRIAKAIPMLSDRRNAEAARVRKA